MSDKTKKESFSRTVKKAFKGARHPRYFHSGWAYFEFAWEFLAMFVVVGMAQFMNGINSMWLFTPMFLTVTVAVNIVLYVYNMFRLGPYYKHRLEFYLKGKCGEVVQQCDRVKYNEIISNDLKFHNDERHFKAAIFGYGALLIIDIILLVLNGQNTFQPLPAVFNSDDQMTYVWVKFIQSGVMVISGSILLFILFEAYSCQMYTHLTAINKKQKEWRGVKGSDDANEDLPTKKENWRLMSAQDQISNMVAMSGVSVYDY